MAYGAYVMNDLAAGRLVRLFDINLPSRVFYSLVCPKSTLNRPRVTAFRDWLISAAALDKVHTATTPEPGPIHAVR